MTTGPLATAVAAASQRPAAAVTRALGAAVALYVTSAMLLGNVPVLSRVPHALVLVMVGLLAARSAHAPLRLRLDAALPLGALFVAYAFASVLWSVDEGYAFVAAVGLAVDFVGAVAVWVALQNGVALRLVAWASAAAAAVQGAVGLHQHYVLGVARAEGLTGNANSFAIQLSLSALLLLLAVPRRHLAGLLALALVVVATLTSGTRKLVFVWFSYLLVVLRDAFPRLRRPSLGLALTLLLAPVAVWASLTFAPTLGLDKVLEQVPFFRRLERTITEGSGTAVRAMMVTDGLEVWSRRPVFGHGIDQYRFAGSFTTYSHNNYVELLADFGVVGLVLYYAVYALVGYRALTGLLAGRRSAWVVLAVLVVYLLMDVARVSYSGRFTWLHLLVLGLVASDHAYPPERRTVEP